MYSLAKPGKGSKPTQKDPGGGEVRSDRLELVLAGERDDVRAGVLAGPASPHGRLGIVERACPERGERRSSGCSAAQTKPAAHHLAVRRCTRWSVASGAIVTPGSHCSPDGELDDAVAAGAAGRGRPRRRRRCPPSRTALPAEHRQIRDARQRATIAPAAAPRRTRRQSSQPLKRKLPRPLALEDSLFRALRSRGWRGPSRAAARLGCDGPIGATPAPAVPVHDVPRRRPAGRSRGPLPVPLRRWGAAGWAPSRWRSSAAPRASSAWSPSSGCCPSRRAIRGTRRCSCARRGSRRCCSTRTWCTPSLSVSSTASCSSPWSTSRARRSRACWRRHGTNGATAARPRRRWRSSWPRCATACTRRTSCATAGARPLNVVHRDVSPHNVMIAYDGHVKILDFGVAKFETGGHETRTGEVKGKMAYMSPEQALGEKLDRRSDLFSVGAVLFECLTGRRMWGDGTDMEVMRRLALEEPPRLDEFCRTRRRRSSSCTRASSRAMPSEPPATRRGTWPSELRAYASAWPRPDTAAVAAMMQRLCSRGGAERSARSSTEALASRRPPRASSRCAGRWIPSAAFERPTMTEPVILRVEPPPGVAAAEEVDAGGAGDRGRRRRERSWRSRSRSRVAWLRGRPPRRRPISRPRPPAPTRDRDRRPRPRPRPPTPTATATRDRDPDRDRNPRPRLRPRGRRSRPPRRPTPTPRTASCANACGQQAARCGSDAFLSSRSSRPSCSRAVARATPAAGRRRRRPARATTASASSRGWTATRRAPPPRPSGTGSPSTASSASRRATASRTTSGVAYEELGDATRAAEQPAVVPRARWTRGATRGETARRASCRRRRRTRATRIAALTATKGRIRVDTGNAAASGAGRRDASRVWRRSSRG